MNVHTNPRTPPESLTLIPLTPPATDENTTNSVWRIIEEIKKRHNGRSLMSTPWAVYILDPKEYQELQHKLQRDESLWGFVEAKLRYDYFPSANRLVLRMHTAIHEFFIIKIVKEIEAQLESIQNASAEFAKEITSGGSTTVKFAEEEYGKHDPDAQFYHSKARFPGIVIEVSYSQKKKYLARLADDYILGSDSAIRVVVGLDLEYKTGKKATLCVWRPNIITNKAGERELVAELVTNQVFRNTNGTPGASSTGGLRLRLRDFATEALAGQNPLRDPIIIPTNKLCLLLEKAEDAASVIEQEIDIGLTNKSWVRKRRRKPSPPEKLTRRDENRFRADERRIANQTKRDDPLYEENSTSEEEGI